MATNNSKKRRSYGLGSPLLGMAPEPIVSQRAPTARDIAEIGTTWLDQPNQAAYILAEVANGAAAWVTAPASGAIAGVSMTINPGDIDVTAGDVNIAAGNLVVAAGNATVGGTITSTGLITANGGIDINGGTFDLDTSANFTVTSTSNTTSAIYLQENGGAAGRVRLHADQGTATDSILLESDGGGITMTAGLASADAFNVAAAAGGVDVDCALQMNLDSSQAAATALRLVASNAAGGIDVDAGTGGIAIDTTGALSIDSAGATNLTTTSASDLTVSSSAGSVIVDGGEAAGDAVQITASNAAGGVDIAAGTGGIDFSSAGIVTMAAATDTQASPTAASTVNANVGAVTFTGFTTAAAGAQVFTITNSLATTTSQIFVTACNEGANDAQMTVTRVNRAAGSFAVTVTNNGAAALNGNITLTWWIIG
jgi:hypothetical protein